jgi:hypothetical protein
MSRSTAPSTAAIGTVAFYLDGGNNITGMRNYGNPSPNPDALEEFRVETSAFAAQYGQFSGAVVSVITKSGTNQVSWRIVRVQPQHRLQRLSLGFNPATGALMKNPLPPQPIWRNVGGPIKHDKAFFFFSYAGLRQVARSKRSRALSCPRLPSVWATLPADTFPVYFPKPAQHAAAPLGRPANQM